MASVRYTKALKEEYARLYSSIEIKSSKLNIVETHIDRILASKSRYEEVGFPLGIPWYFIAAIHTMESSRNFERHLHNGDSLTKRTRQVPAGRPKKGNPPFTWEESALDALTMKNLNKVDDWSIEHTLYLLEAYNGWGYRLYRKHVLSPYLWSYSNHYISGKYVADGRWSDTAISRQVGAAVLLRRLEQRGEITITAPAKLNSPVFKLSNKKEDRADDLQKFLNTFPGNSLLVDGWPGNKTSDAVKRLFGFRLKGDNRD